MISSNQIWVKIYIIFKGEIIGWVERSASEKLRRKLEKEPPAKESSRESLESIESDDDAFAKTGTTPPKGKWVIPGQLTHQTNTQSLLPKWVITFLGDSRWTLTLPKTSYSLKFPPV